MEIYSSLKSLSKHKIYSSTLTIGTFDGIHLGHQHLIKNLIDMSSKNNNKSVIITFSPNPYIVINKQKSSEYHIISNNEKYSLLEDFGVDILFEIQFDLNISEISAINFLKDFIISPFNPSDIIVGYDHHFGYKREGNSDFLIKNCKKYGYNIHVVEAFEKQGVTVSSSLIRRLISNHEIESANLLLGKNYKIIGKVIKGSNIGRSISFPTANLSISTISQIIPGDGVYFVKAYINSDKYMGMCNIGYRPTISDGQDRGIEVHLFNYDKFDLYNQFIEIEFVDYIRSEKKFGNKEELKEQLMKDKEYCKSLII